MKLIKFKIVRFPENYYVIENVSNKIYSRTIRFENIKDCIKAINNNQVKCSKFSLEYDEELIFELEFEKLEDLIELVPEEFL